MPTPLIILDVNLSVVAVRGRDIAAYVGLAPLVRDARSLAPHSFGTSNVTAEAERACAVGKLRITGWIARGELTRRDTTCAQIVCAG